MLRIITCNLNGVRAAARKGFFRWMHEQEPDSVCLQETKAQEHQLQNEGRRFVVCGDYNIAHREIDVFDPKSRSRVTGFLPQERAWFDDVTERVGWVARSAAGSAAMHS